MCNHVHHEQIVAGEMTQDIIPITAVQEQVIFQELLPVVEQTQETIDVTPQRSQFAPNTSSTSTSQHDFTSSSSTSTISDAVAIMLKSLTSTEEVERAAIWSLQWRSLRCRGLPWWSLTVLRRNAVVGLGSLRCRVYLAPSAWPPIRHA